MVLLLELLDLFIECLFHLILGAFQLLNLVSDGLLVVTKFVLEFVDVLFLVTGGCSLTHISLGWVLQLLELRLLLVSHAIDLVHLWLFGEDLITELHDGTFTPFTLDKTTSWVSVTDLIDNETSILSRCEEEVIVVTDAHAFNSLVMGLHLIEFLNMLGLLVWVLPDLNGSRLALLTDTSEESLGVGQDLHLGDVVLGWGALVLTVCGGHPDLSVCADDDGLAVLLGHVADAHEVDVLLGYIIVKNTVAILLLLDKVEEIARTVHGTTGEAHIVIPPVNATDLTVVSLALKLGWHLSSVEVVHIDDVANTT